MNISRRQALLSIAASPLLSQLKIEKFPVKLSSGNYREINASCYRNRECGCTACFETACCDLFPKISIYRLHLILYEELSYDIDTIQIFPSKMSEFPLLNLTGKDGIFCGELKDCVSEFVRASNIYNNFYNLKWTKNLTT